MAALTARIVKVPGQMSGRAHIEGTRVRVMDVVGLMRANGWSATDAAEQLPHISVADVLAAVDYYVHHTREIEDAILEDDRRAEAFRAEATSHTVTLAP